MNDRGNPGTVIDMDHTPGAWTSSPTADYPTCASQAYMTIDLGDAYTTTGATLWHFGQRTCGRPVKNTGPHQLL